jgi:putative oxidoreductase
MSDQVVADRTPQGLLILRLTLALFFAQWSIEKFIHPEAAVSIFAHFYGLQISALISYVFGAVELALTIGLLLGVAKTIALGGLIAIHGISVLVSWYQLLHPWAAVPNHLFIASIPVLGALIALFLLRDRDTLLILKVGQP